MAFPPARIRKFRTPGAKQVRVGLGFSLKTDRSLWARFERELEKAALKGFGKEMMPAMRAVGKLFKRKVKSGIRRGAPGGVPLRRNAPATIEKKGSSRPLIDSGFLVNTIVTRTRRVAKNRIRTTIGPPRLTPHPSGGGRRRTVGRIAAFHEFGFFHRGKLVTQFLRRPFLRPTLRVLRPEIVSTFRRIFGREVSARLFFFGPQRPPISGGIFRA